LRRIRETNKNGAKHFEVNAAQGNVSAAAPLFLSRQTLRKPNTSEAKPKMQRTRCILYFVYCYLSFQGFVAMLSRNLLTFAVSGLFVAALAIASGAVGEAKGAKTGRIEAASPKARVRHDMPIAGGAVSEAQGAKTGRVEAASSKARVRHEMPIVVGRSVAAHRKSRLHHLKVDPSLIEADLKRLSEAE
jgi:hypothetical protein